MCSKLATWKGDPLMWMLPLYLHINQESVDDNDDDESMKEKILYFLAEKVSHGQCTANEYQQQIFMEK